MRTVLNLSWLGKAIWLVGFIIETSLVFVLVFRKKLKGLPVFMPFIAYGSLKTIVLFLTSWYGTKREYFWTYWIGAFASDPIEYWLLAEIVRDALRPLKVWGKSIERSMLIWAAIIVVTATLLAAGIGGPEGAKSLELWQIRASLFSNTVMCCMLTVLATTVVSHGSLGRPHLVAVSRGLLVWSFSQLLLDFVHSIVGWNHNLQVLDYIREFLYLGVELYWVVVFWNPEKPRPPLPPEAIAFMEALHDQVKSDLQRLGEPPK